MSQPKKQKSRKQKFYKMKGCSKKKYLGGSDMNLAYTGKPIFSLPNPHLAYTGPTNNNSNKTLMYISIGIGVVALLILIFFTVKYYIKNKKKY
jgi:hypothetical protein